MNFDDASRVTGKDDEIAQGVVKGVHNIMMMGAAAMRDNGARVVLIAGCSLPALNTLAMSFGEHQPGDHVPANEELTTFGAFYMIAAVENADTNHLCVGFSPEILSKALRLFKAHTGRDYTGISPNLLRMIAEQEKKANEAAPVHLKKFLPN